MSFLNDVLFLMKKNEWVDDIDFINTSYEYLCIKDYNDIFTKGEKVLIKNDNENIFLVVFIEKNKDNINIIRVEFEKNVSINDYFKRTRLIKIEEFLKNGKME